MNITELINKHKIISGILVLLLFLSFQSFFNPKDRTNIDTENNNPTDQNNQETINLKDKLSPTSNPVPNITHTPTFDPSSVSDAVVDGFDITNIDTRYQLKPFLPFTSEDFIIEGYTAPYTLKVKIKNRSDIPKVKETVEEWMTKNQLIPGIDIVNWE
jgi:hypothetical protein